MQQVFSVYRNGEFIKNNNNNKSVLFTEIKFNAGPIWSQVFIKEQPDMLGALENDPLGNLSMSSFHERIWIYFTLICKTPQSLSRLKKIL